MLTQTGSAPTCSGRVAATVKHRLARRRGRLCSCWTHVPCWAGSITTPEQRTGQCPWKGPRVNPAGPARQDRGAGTVEYRLARQGAMRCFEGWVNPPGLRGRTGAPGPWSTGWRGRAPCAALRVGLTRRACAAGPGRRDRGVPAGAAGRHALL